MAEKRMFTQQIIDSDAFLDMPLSAQALYFHLSMRADDDGFVKNPRKIQRMINAGDDDLRLLIAKRFVLIFESGVIVIKHWRLHNTLRKDRYKPTVFQDEFKRLELKSNGAYTERAAPVGCQTVSEWLPEGCQHDAKLAPQNRLDKNRLDISITSKDVIVETAVSNPQTSESEKVEKPKTSIDCPYQKIIADYNEILGPYLGMCQKLTPTRQKAIQARWRDCMKDGDFKTQDEGIAYFKRYFEYIKTCGFLMGDNDRNWRADFDWIFKLSCYTKICEGKYLSR